VQADSFYFGAQQRARKEEQPKNLGCICASRFIDALKK
jgi:hypothetical protein